MPPMRFSSPTEPNATAGISRKSSVPVTLWPSAIRFIRSMWIPTSWPAGREITTKRQAALKRWFTCRASRKTASSRSFPKSVLTSSTSASPITPPAKPFAFPSFRSGWTMQMKTRPSSSLTRPTRLISARTGSPTPSMNAAVREHAPSSFGAFPRKPALRACAWATR